MYDISVSIVTYNNAEIIEKTLSRLVSNIDEELKHIIYVIDNLSSDGTADISKNIKGNITVIENKKNLGFGKGHNVILKDLNSRYHIVMNPDITIDNNILLEMTSFMDARPDIGLLTPLIRYDNGSIQYLCKRNPTFADLFIRLLLPGSFKKRQNYFTMMETNYAKEFTVEYSTGCFMFFRTEIYKKIKGFDENFFMYMEDADITRRVNQISKTVFYPYNHVYHSWQRGAHKQLRLLLINLHSAWYYFKKWGFRLF